MVVEYIMRMIKEKIIELKNIYTGEIVFSSNLYEKRVDGTMTFIQVYKPEELIFLCGEDCDWFSNCETHDCALKRDAFSKCNVFIRELA